MSTVKRVKLTTIPKTLSRMLKLGEDDLIEVEIENQKAILRPVKLAGKIQKGSVREFAKAVLNFPAPEIASDDSVNIAEEHDEYIYTKH